MNASNILFNNVSYKYCKYWEPDSDLEKDVKYIAMIFLCVFGILSNIFIIVLAVKYTVRKNLHHLIINMAVSDALFLEISLLHEISRRYHIEQFYPNGVGGDIICKVIPFVKETSYKVSLVTLLVISIERFRATRRTLQWRPQLYTVKQRVAVLSICWLIPMTQAVYWLYDFEFDEEEKQCISSRSKKTNKEKIIINFIISFCIMISVIFIILTLSAITVTRLSKSQLTQARLNQQQQVMRRKQTRSAVSMVFSSTLLYACCWFSFNVFDIIFSISYYNPKLNSIFLNQCIDWFSLFYITMYILPAVNSCFSPFIYLIFLPDFKEAAKRVLCCCKTTTSQRDVREDIPLHHIQR